MFVLFGVMFWVIWFDLIIVFSYFDSIMLWYYNGFEVGVVVVKSVMMGSLLFVIIVVMVVWVFICNLFGLLEVLVFLCLNMCQGVLYVIIMIFNYVIIVVGVMIVFGLFGVLWDKFQWLVVVLLVGFGFGLQEIFGNFVLGLIIFFECLVCIGDMVMIGIYFGMVSKICICVIIIIDFDCKEVIILNKVFVMEWLINWFFFDIMICLVIWFGVVYGLDLEKVKRVLLQVVMEYLKVMYDLEFVVFFIIFGVSILDYELCLYVCELCDCSYMVDELNCVIDCVVKMILILFLISLRCICIM